MLGGCTATHFTNMILLSIDIEHQQLSCRYFFSRDLMGVRSLGKSSVNYAVFAFHVYIIKLMGVVNTKACLLFMMIYSFFTCFIMNAFGYALSYDQLTYEWNIPNIYEGRKAVFNAAFIHFLIFLACVVYHFKRKISKKIQFKKVKSSQSDFIQAEDNDIV